MLHKTNHGKYKLRLSMSTAMRNWNGIHTRN
jgi:hypothetical protein